MTDATVLRLRRIFAEHGRDDAFHETKKHAAITKQDRYVLWARVLAS